MTPTHLIFCLSFIPPFAISGTVYDKQSIPRSLVSLLPVWAPGSLHTEVLDVSVKHSAGFGSPGLNGAFQTDYKRKKMNHDRSLKSEKRQEDVRGQEKLFPPGDETLVSRLKSRTMGNNWEQL